MNIVQHFDKNCKSTDAGILYLASPVDLFFEEPYKAALEAARRRFPKLTVFEPAREFSGTPDWLRRWPEILPQISTLVVVPREDSSIGAGCAREILDFAAFRLHGVPAAFAPPGRVRVGAIPGIFVWEGCLNPLRWFSLALSATAERVALVGSRALPARPPARRYVQVWEAVA